jgi:hypothetical protein
MSEFKWDDKTVKDFCWFAYAPGSQVHPELDRFISEYKDYWAHMHRPKPEWEILSYEDRRSMSDMPIGRVDRRHHFWNIAVVSNWPIHSVKRLSDGEVFTVGDRVGYGFDGTPNQFFIESFHIYDKWMAVRGGGVEAVDITLLNRSAGDVCPLTPNEIKQLRKILYCK